MTTSLVMSYSNILIDHKNKKMTYLLAWKASFEVFKLILLKKAKINFAKMIANNFQGLEVAKQVA